MFAGFRKRLRKHIRCRFYKFYLLLIQIRINRQTRGIGWFFRFVQDDVPYEYGNVISQSVAICGSAKSKLSPKGKVSTGICKFKSNEVPRRTFNVDVLSGFHRNQECTLHVHVPVHPAALLPSDQLFLDVRRRWVTKRNVSDPIP